MKKALSLLLFFSLFSIQAFSQACPVNRPDLFCLTAEMSLNKEIDQTIFYTIPARIISLFYPEMQKNNQVIQLDARWDSPYFGAGITRDENIYSMMILAGTTRIKDFTQDAYAALVCHELGHVLGGYPKQSIPHAEWASSEGQSDYFAASVCLPRYFKAIGLGDDQISSKVEKAGFEMLHSFKAFNSGVDDGFGNEIIRYYEHTYKASSTLINQYPSLQCRYENFRDPKQRPSCWFKD